MSFARPPPRPSNGPSSDAATTMQYDAHKKSVLVAYLLWFFLGAFGVHRFYLGRIVSGLVMLALTVGGGVLTVVLVGYLGLALGGMWWLIDAMLIPGMVQGHNTRLIARLR